MGAVFIGGIAVGAFFGFLISAYFTETPEETEAINCALCYEQMRKRYLEELDEKTIITGRKTLRWNKQVVTPSIII